ncbi:MAG: hypothetical protein II161_03155 [Erysipelotrichaceae bacterium]|nr:hypothetical protein [Erysipelotrichaceae bacterium]
MDVILDILLDLIFDGVILEGAIDASRRKRIPLGWRILLVAGMIAIYGGILALLIYVAVAKDSPEAWGIAAALTLTIIAIFIKKYQERKNRISAVQNPRE